jgi:hypothetical protein
MGDAVFNRIFEYTSEIRRFKTAAPDQFYRVVFPAEK